MPNRFPGETPTQRIWSFITSVATALVIAVATVAIPQAVAGFRLGVLISLFVVAFLAALNKGVNEVAE